MKLKLSLLILFTATFLSVVAQSNQVSQNTDISILTIGPGDNLNDAFGHCAFRISDKNLGIDVVYGYGEYDFDTPNFYLKFAQGKLNYQMSKNDFSDFYNYYVYFNRTIEEQVLNISQVEKQRLYDYLTNNYKPENRKYLYDFFYDNCATRIRDVAEIAMEEKIFFKSPSNFESKTFRQLIHDHTGLNSWGSLGIDMALGSVIDREATPYEYMFLPKYIHDFFGSAKLETDKNLVKKSNVLYKQLNIQNSTSFMLSPLIILSCVAMLIMYITYSDYRTNKRSKLLDIFLFGITGLLGILMLLLWFATDHSATSQNYNLLWAFPLNLFIIGQLFNVEPKKWFRKYLKFTFILLVLLALHWLMKVQVYAIALIPILIALGMRYIFLIKFFNK